MNYIFEPQPQPWLPIDGEDWRFPVGRIFCVGRNYAAHAAEMGNSVDREAPFYFTKSAHHIAQSGAELPMPPGTQDYHHEVELVLALGHDLSGATSEEGVEAIFAYGVGLDMTRRDLQAAAKDKRRPWDVAKDVENGAILGPLCRSAAFGDLVGKEITLQVNGETRQAASLSDMVWPVGPLLAHLSSLYHLQAGDIVMMGTPAGVGPVAPGDHLLGRVSGAPEVEAFFV